MRIVLALLFCIVSAAAVAQTFPSKPLRIVVRAPPGGTDDLLARLISQKMMDVLGQPMVTDYRTGAGGLVAWEYTAKAPPDGYTILLAASGLGAIKTLRADATVDPWRDFAWISQVTSYQLIMVAHPSLPVKSVKELADYIRARPGQVNYASSGNGTSAHLSGAMFVGRESLKATHVPYRGGAQALTDLLRGEVQFMFYQVLPVLPHIAEGKLRALAIASGKRSAALPEVPTMEEAGIGDFDVSAWFGVYAPRKTSPDVVARLGATIVQIANAPEVQKTLVAQGIDPVSGRAEDLLALTKSEVARWAKVVEIAGARLP